MANGFSLWGTRWNPVEILNEITKIIIVPLRLLDELYEFGNVGLLPGEDLVPPRWANAGRGEAEPAQGSVHQALTLLPA